MRLETASCYVISGNEDKRGPGSLTGQTPASTLLTNQQIISNPWGHITDIWLQEFEMSLDATYKGTWAPVDGLLVFSEDRSAKFPIAPFATVRVCPEDVNSRLAGTPTTGRSLRKLNNCALFYYKVQ